MSKEESELVCLICGEKKPEKELWNCLCKDCLTKKRAEENQKDQHLAELKAEVERLKERVLSEKEWQGYCAYKHIEKEIKGCLDRERDYKQQLKEKDEEIAKLKKDKQWWKDHHKKANGENNR